MSYIEYQTLILNYFNTDPLSWRNSDLNMFTFCVYRWLREKPFDSNLSSADAYHILIRICNAVKLLIARRDLEICEMTLSKNGVDWLDWLPYKIKHIAPEPRGKNTMVVFRDLLHRG